MAYTNTHVMRLKDGKSLASKIKAITENHEQRLLWLEELATSLLGVTNSVITNITKED